MHTSLLNVLYFRHISKFCGISPNFLLHEKVTKWGKSTAQTGPELLVNKGKKKKNGKGTPAGCNQNEIGSAMDNSKIP